MSVVSAASLEELLLLRSGLVFVRTSVSGSPPQALAPADRDLGQRESLLVALDLELANLGYVASVRLRERLKDALVAELVELRQRVIVASAKATGGTRALEPLFRRFPEGIPDDTFTLWWDRVVVYFLQSPEQPCVLCRRSGTIHALSPCAHLVCERCFDGSSYSGCPICNAKVDRDSPFFTPPPPRADGPSPDRKRFALLDLGNPTSEHTLDAAARELLVALCQRTQVLSPSDVDALSLLMRERPRAILGWLPPTIPVRENLALVFGTLLRRAVDECRASRLDAASPIAALFAALRPHVTSATDVLRLLCAYSGASVALLSTAKLESSQGAKAAKRFGKRATDKPGWIVVQHHRFPVARMPRALRREALAVLDRFWAERLLEDLRRHQARWVWLAEHLHPGEHAARFPTAARAFAVLRDGASAVPDAPRTWPSAVEHAIAGRRHDEALALLTQRPGELLRRLDKLLREAPSAAPVLGALSSVIERMATPALLTVRAHLAARSVPVPWRVFWPKAGYHVPPAAGDRRPTLDPAVVAEGTRRIDRELLRRFAGKPAFATAVLDQALASIVVPFGERTASRSAVQLPRGSALALPAGKSLRLFLHWCEPQSGARTTDIDLSIGFFDAAWRLGATCSYYELTAHDDAGRILAKSSGDFTSAPWPDGAAEFVDLDRAAARAAGLRYAVMVVTAYRGLPFRALERGAAGVMLREGTAGEVFDPRAVELAFALGGEHGVFLPLLVDLETSTLHWLDVYSPGELAFNNVANAQRDLARISPAMLAYFASGTRPSMLELGRLHAAARCRRVLVRQPGGEVDTFVRGADETAEQLLARLRAGQADRVDRIDRADRALAAEPLTAQLGEAPVLALLAQGDLSLPAGSSIYAVLRRRVVPTLHAADLLS